MLASGTFEVQLNPLDPYAQGQEGIQLGRFSIDKVFQGDLEATSRGEMLSANPAVEGSAAYVAIEQVRGSLSGRNGGFVLQHFGVMAGGENRLLLEVVPDSGSGELTGLSGSMEINMEGGAHRYRFEYSLEL